MKFNLKPAAKPTDQPAVAKAMAGEAQMGLGITSVQDIIAPSAIEVDLTGQVCSDSIGPKPYSGFGGQVDFIRGAARSRGGKPIITLPSTACDGRVSRIAPFLKQGAGVVTSRADVHYVVTEYGVAYLHGKNLRQRAEALISIAHPAFREELSEAAVREGWIEERIMVER